MNFDDYDETDDEMEDVSDLPQLPVPVEPRQRGRPRSADHMAIVPFILREINGLAVGADAPAKSHEALIAGQFSPHTRRAYEGDVLLFQRFLDAIGRASLADVIRDDLIAYRAWLISRYAPATVNRRLSVMRSLFREALLRGEIEHDPSSHLRQMRVADESPTAALDSFDARVLLDSIDRSTLLGARDYALLALLLRTGLRRSEIGTLTLKSIGIERGHHTLTVYGKGNKRRLVKLPVDVHRSLQEWLDLRLDVERRHTGIQSFAVETPVFVEVRKVGRGEDARYRAVGKKGLSADAIWVIVRRHVVDAGILSNITPHSLRHTFITLALEGHAPLHKVQYAAGHADPRTTERYHHRKENLDDNAADYVKI